MPVLFCLCKNDWYTAHLFQPVASAYQPESNGIGAGMDCDGGSDLKSRKRALGAEFFCQPFPGHFLQEAALFRIIAIADQDIAVIRRAALFLQVGDQKLYDAGQ